MAKKIFHRRRFGFEEKETKNGSDDHGRARIEKPRPFLQLLLFPFAILGWILSLLFRRKEKSGKRERFSLGFVFKKLLLAMVVLGVIGFLGLTVMAAWISTDLPDPDRLTDRKVAESSKIYDRTGEHLLYEIFADQKRTLVAMDQIPKQLIEAVLATEDTSFYEHGGIRPLSMLRAVVVGTFTNKRIGATSTLTQQLVKNAILSPERTPTRKLKEIILAIRLEQRYSKEQILQIYFNEIPYGSTNYGIESASQSYFGKHVSDLTLEQIATLAGFPKAPSRYLKDKESLRERRNLVLRRMFEEGYVTEEAMKKTQAEEVSLSQRFGEIKAPHFVLDVRDQLVAQYGEQAVDTEGLRITTTLDWEKQQIAEDIIATAASSTLIEAKANNVALVAMDPKTGQVLSLVGSRDFFNEEIDGQFSVATLGKRQPGSSFKPIIYTAAFEKGYTPETLLFDVQTNFAVSGKSYTPKNYDLKERGPVIMRQALQMSLNIPAVQTLYLVGEKQGVEFAKRLGYSTLSDGNFGLSLVLGGGEVILLEHTAAFGVFAANGVRHPSVFILKVENAKGDVLFEWKPSAGEEVMKKEIAATISNILTDDAARAPVFGAGGYLTLPGRPVAAKTGTTNNYVDAWTVGYTPSLVTGVWAGNTNNTPMKSGFGGNKVAGLIWNGFMKKALEGTPTEGFPPPPPNTAEKPILRGSAGGAIVLAIDTVTGKRATSSTPEQYIKEKTFLPPHSILHYVNKDDPRGPVPNDPAQDPQYAIWEAAIQDWAKRKAEQDPTWSVSFEEPPTEYDDLHSLELIPSLTVFSPQPNETLFSRSISASISASAPRGVTKVQYKIDAKQVGTVTQSPFGLSYYAQGLADGLHTLTILVEDDIGNTRKEDIPFVLAAGVELPNVSWSAHALTIAAHQFPTSFFLTPFRLSDMEALEIWLESADETKEKIETITNLALVDGKIPFVWKESPGTGVWQLIARPVLKNDTFGQERTLEISVVDGEI